MGTAPGDVAADTAKLDALVKDAEEAEEKAVAARRRARAARTLLEEEEQAAVVARQLVPGSSAGPRALRPPRPRQLGWTASSSTGSATR
jgi:hypothetical protein